jgi:hypothetical protein
MAKKTEPVLPTWVNFLLGTGLLITMWLVSSFPIAAFFAFTPLLVIAARAGSRKEWEWGSYDLIWVALSAGFFAAADFQAEKSIPSLLLAVVFTLPFLLGGWIQRNTTPHVGWAGTVVLWTSFEFALTSLKSGIAVDLSHVFAGSSGWIRWTRDLGTLSAGTWILLVNAAWAAALQGGRYVRTSLTAGGILIVAPIGTSLLLYPKFNIPLAGGEPVAIVCVATSILLLAIAYFRAR